MTIISAKVNQSFDLTRINFKHDFSTDFKEFSSILGYRNTYL